MEISWLRVRRFTRERGFHANAQSHRATPPSVAPFALKSCGVYADVSNGPRSKDRPARCGRRELRSRMTTNLIDRAALLDRVGGDRELLEKLYEAFLQDQARYIAQMHSGLDGGDLEVLYEGVHGLQGCISNFCASSTFELTSRLRQAVAAGQAEQVEALVPQVEESLRALSDGLRELVHEG